MMIKWPATWPSSWAKSPHVSVTVAVFVFVFFSLLLSTTTVSLSGTSVLVGFRSFTTNVTAFFSNVNNNVNNSSAASFNMSSVVGRIRQDCNSELESNSSTTAAEKDSPSIKPVIRALTPTGLEDNNSTLREESEEDHDQHHHSSVAPNVSWSDAAAQGPSPEILDQDVQLSTTMSDEKFLMPILSYQVGAGNQLMEYMSAAIIARALNRTLCLADFFSGPNKHTGTWVRARGGLAMEDRYDQETLSRFVNVTSKANCLKQCHEKLDAQWLLKPMRDQHVRDWKSVPTTNESLQLSWEYVRWQTPADIAEVLGSSNELCVAVGGLFPGLRWRGGFLAVSAFLQPSDHIAALADQLQELAIGINIPYLAVHWRFEESECGPHKIGLCFVRCSDGAVIDSGLHPHAKEWIGVSIDQCKDAGHFRGVGLDKFDVFNAIFDRAQNYSLKTVYLATDGWIRGEEGAMLVKEAVEELRNRGLSVVGLWGIENLPNFSDGSTFDPMSTLGTSPVNSQQIALVEQEICTRSTVFLGSGQSTWSLAVFRLRLARRRAKQILESQLNATGAGKPQGINKQVQEDKAVIEELMKDKHAAGLQCRYSEHFNTVIVNATVETYADEAPDGWLDLEACEGRIGRGGNCKVAKCF